jgi:hypothetical protein
MTTTTKAQTEAGFKIVKENIILEDHRAGGPWGRKMPVFGSVAQLDDGRLIARYRTTSVSGEPTWGTRPYDPQEDPTLCSCLPPAIDWVAWIDRNLERPPGWNVLDLRDDETLECERFLAAWPRIAFKLGIGQATPPATLFDVGVVQVPRLAIDPVLFRQLVNAHASTGGHGAYGRHQDTPEPTESQMWTLDEQSPAIVNLVSIRTRSGVVRSRFRMSAEDNNRLHPPRELTGGIYNDKRYAAQVPRSYHVVTTLSHLRGNRTIIFI